MLMMVPKEDRFDENSLNSSCTSESSDSYSYVLGDVENPSSRINEEWEAIERTLYEENGKHVTDPALLKECQLWRETFPHIRVRGRGLNVDNKRNVEIQTTKSVQPKEDRELESTKLGEKREKIKQKVVSQIVERLLTKLSLDKEGSENSLGLNEKAEVNEDRKSNLGMKSSRIQLDKESYFERGKGAEDESSSRPYIAEKFAAHANKKFSESENFSDFCEDLNYKSDNLKSGTSANAASPRSKPSSNEKRAEDKEWVSNLAKNEEILRSGHLTFKISEKKPRVRVRTDQPSDSLSNVAKPFEMTRKIDKKYETILESILENKGFGNYVSAGKRSPNANVRTHNGASQKVVGGSLGREDYGGKKSKQFPKVNNFSNNWLSRAEQNSNQIYGEIGESTCRNFMLGNYDDPLKNPRNFNKFMTETCRSAHESSLGDERFLEELAKEMWDHRTSGRENCEEEINLTRPQLRLNRNYTAKTKTQKSSSCGDIQKKCPKTSGRMLKSGLEKGKSELTVKNGSKMKTGRKAGNANVQLPPIETSIICTEIVGRPKVATRTFPKKYF